MSSHFSRYNARTTVTNGGFATWPAGYSRSAFGGAAWGIRPAENKKLEISGSKPMDILVTSSGQSRSTCIYGRDDRKFLDTLNSRMAWRKREQGRFAARFHAAALGLRPLIRSEVTAPPRSRRLEPSGRRTARRSRIAARAAGLPRLESTGRR